MKVGIVLINYKNYVNRFLQECRDTLEKQTFPRENFSVYIVDNASSPESVDYIKKNYPQAKILSRTDGNYCAANNLGAKKAVEDGCEAVVFSNLDVSYDKFWLEELVKALTNDKKIGLVQSKVLLYPKNEDEKKAPLINSLGNQIHYLGFGQTSGYKEKDRVIDGLPEITGYASGCSIIVKREVLEKIGGNDEEFYMYHDDLELSCKVRLAGYKIVLAPKSIIYHKYEFGRSVMMVYYMERNRYLTVLTFYKWPTLILILPALIVMNLGLWLFSIINQWFIVKLRVTGYFFKPKSWVYIFRKRKEISKLRGSISDREFTKNFVGQVLFQEIENPLLKYIGNPLINGYWRLIKKIIFW
jgi:GT2 family glycosyltransferase